MLGVPGGRTPADPPLARRRACSARRARSRRAPRTSRPSSNPGHVLARAHRREAQEPGRRHAVAPDAGHGRPGRRRADRSRRHRDHRLRRAPRRRRRGDRDEARRQRGRAVLPASRPVAEDRRRPREDPVGRRRDPALLAAVAVPGTVLRAGARARGRHRSRGVPRAPHHRRGDARPARLRARRRVRRRTATGHHHRVRPRRAQLPRAPRWPAWRAASRSKRSPSAGDGSRSTSPACAG